MQLGAYRATASIASATVRADDANLGMLDGRVRCLHHEVGEVRQVLVHVLAVRADESRDRDRLVVDPDVEALADQRSASSTSGLSRRSSVPGLNARPSIPIRRLPRARIDVDRPPEVLVVRREDALEQRKLEVGASGARARARAGPSGGTSRRMRSRDAGTPRRCSACDRQGTARSPRASRRPAPCTTLRSRSRRRSSAHGTRCRRT